MMQNNFYFLRQLSKELAQHLVGMELATCFTQNKDELILGFCKPNQDFYIRATLRSDFACLNFLEEFQRAKKNTVALFTDLIGLEVKEVIQFQNDRSFSIVLAQHKQLLFKMHGNRSNILVIENETVSDIFLKKHLNDWDITPPQLHRPITQTWEAFKVVEGDYKQLYPTFNKLMKQQVEQLLAQESTLEAQWKALQNFIAQLENPTYYVGQIAQIPTLSLLQVEELEEAVPHKTATTALNDFYYAFTKITQLDKEKATALKKLERLKKRAQNYIKKTSAKLKEIENSTHFEEMANILMANLHQIPAQAKSVELHDFYKEAPIQIKLKPDLSPQKNAELYYKKAKNAKIEVEVLQRNLEEKEETYQSLLQHIAAVEAFEHLRPLRKYLKAHLKDYEENRDEVSALFKRFELQVFTILIGKNAKNNDLLTQRYTYKEDLWLHAKDVSGSHVVIKYQSGKSFPKEVIEKAAQLAGYYSKRKNDSLCPVIVTPKKFVRKPKGLADGQVVVEKEEVMMVEPKPY
ncbi:MAG: NFACT RNA binding domain-containing protein [Thermonemataceae bacterium]